jgi:hypothetical protein
MIARADKQLQRKSLTILDQVGRIARKGNLEDDGSFVKLNIAGLYMDRARALTRFTNLRKPMVLLISRGQTSAPS